MSWLEWYGYAGSILVAVSLMMKNMWKLRWINLAGAAIFSTYGLLIGAWPVFALNAFIVIVDAYYIWQMWNTSDFFSIEPLPPGDQIVVRRLLDFYQSDIKNFFPEFDGSIPTPADVLVIFRNQVPVGLFIFRRESGGLVRIQLDYVIPDYRDLKNARFLYDSQQEFFRGQGFHSFMAVSRVKSHQTYLEKIGFIRDTAHPDHFIKPI